VVPVCLFLLPLFVWQAQLLLAGLGVDGPDVFLVSLLEGLTVSIGKLWRTASDWSAVAG